AVDRVHEVAVDGRDAAERAVGAGERVVRPVDRALDAGSGAVDRREGLDERVAAATPRRGRARADDALHRANLGRYRGRVAAALDEDDERLHRAGGDPGVGQQLPPGDRGAATGEVLELRLVRVHLQAVGDEHADHGETAERHGPRTPQHEPGPAAPRAV